MSNHEPYEPILHRNLEELRLGGKNIKHLNKIKIFDEDVLAEKLQRAYRYEPEYAIESLDFNYTGWWGRSKHVQQLWQTELKLYNSSAFARKPAQKTFFHPSLYNCYLKNSNAYFTEFPLEQIIDVIEEQCYDSNASRMEILNGLREDVLDAFLHTIYSSIAYLAGDSQKNGEIVVLSLLPIRYDEECPSCLSAIQDDVPLMNNLISDYCLQHHIRFINVFPLFADNAGLLRKDLSDDGLFLNENGYNLLTKVVSCAIENGNQNSTGENEQPL